MNRTDIAWLAGLFEGEGCFEIAKNGGTRITINMTDLDVIERVDSLFPCKAIAVRPQKRGKTCYAWRIGGPEKTRDFIDLVLPYLGERRTIKAREVLAHLDSRIGVGGYYKSKTHCAQGHEYTPENTIIRPGTDHRRCRTCVKRWEVEYRTRKRLSASA